MYSLSFCAALGLTLICSTTSGQPAPTISELSSNSTRPIAGNAQVAQHDRGEHRDRADQRDRHQDQLGRQHRVDIGVAGAGERLAAAGVAEQFVAVQPVGDRLEHHQHADQDDQLDAGRRGSARRRGRPAGYRRRCSAPTRFARNARNTATNRIRQHQPVERQVEGVEAEVLAELRVGDAEVAAVQEQLDTRPVALRDQRRRARRSRAGMPMPNSFSRDITAVR